MGRFRITSAGRLGDTPRPGALLGEMKRQRRVETVPRDAVGRHAHPDERELAPDEPAQAVDLRTTANAGHEPVRDVPHLSSSSSPAPPSTSSSLSSTYSWTII